MAWYEQEKGAIVLPENSPWCWHGRKRWAASCSGVGMFSVYQVSAVAAPCLEKAAAYCGMFFLLDGDQVWDCLISDIFSSAKSQTLT